MSIALFFRYGSFSHSNRFVLDGLQAQFPEVRIVDVDLKYQLRTSKLHVGLSLAEAWARYGTRRLAASGGKALALRTIRGWQLLSDTARRAAAEVLNGHTPLFTFQTQTVFDASLGTAPHFIYTDHAHLTNLYYPSYKPQNLLAPAWIDSERLALRRASRVFVMSCHVERSLVDLYQVDPSRIVLVGVGQNAAVQSDVARDAATVLFVGMDWERKGGPVLIDAFDRLIQRRPDARLVVVGCSPTVSRPYLTIAGRVPLEAVASYYSTATLFCLPTRIEPFGIVAIEAMANGLPPVLPRLGAFPDFVKDGYTGYLFRPEDPADLAATLDRALAESDELSLIGQRGRELVRTRYDWPLVMDGIASVIRGDLAAS